MTPYKFGAILALLLAVITVPVFSLFEELHVIIPINILLVGVPLLILYFIFVYIYRNFSRRVFFISLIVFLSIPVYFLTKEIYKNYTNNLKYEEWKDFSNVQEELQIGKDITMSYSANEND